MNLPPDSPSARTPLLLSRVRQLAQWHAEFGRDRPGRRAAAVTFAGVLAATWLPVFGLYGQFVEASYGNAALFATCFAGPLAAFAAWRVARRTRRHQAALAAAGLRAKVLQLSQEFPERVRAWGGPQALCNPQVVAEVLRQLEAR